MAVRSSILWRAPLAGAVAAAGINAPAPDVAQAADAIAAAISAKPVGGVFRIAVNWPDSLADNPPSIAAELEDEVLVVRFSQALNADVSDLPLSAPDMIRAARIDPDGKTLRLALKSDVKARVDSSYNRQAIDLAAPDYKGKYPGVDSLRAKNERDAKAAVAQRAAAAEAARLAAPPTVVDVSVGQTKNLTRIAFEWKKQVGYSLKVDKNQVHVRFAIRAKADIADLRIDPPNFVKNVEQTTDSRALTVVLTMQDGVVARHFRDGDFIVVDLAPAPKPELAESEPPAEDLALKKEAGGPVALHPKDAAQTPPQSAPEIAAAPQTATPSATEANAPSSLLVHGDPVAVSGDVKVEVESSKRGAELAVMFDKPAAASVFRRGKYIYAMFAADARFDVRSHITGADALPITQLRAPGVSGLRIQAPDNLYVSARSEGARWLIRLTQSEPGAPEPMQITPDDGVQGIELKAILPGAAALGAVIDPDTGARIDIAMAYGPPTGIVRERQFVEAAALQTAHGAAFEAFTDDMTFAVERGAVRLRRTPGLLLSTRAAVIPQSSRRAAIPGFIDFDSWKGPAGQRPYDQIEKLEAAAAMAPPGPAAARARMNLARVLLGYELAPEALGALNLALDEDPKLEKTTAFRAMRGAANVMLGRMADAEADFNAPSALSDPSVALWRGMVLLAKEDFGGARDAFMSGQEAAPLYSPNWRAKFQSAAARAALGISDAGSAQALIKAALTAGATGEALDEAKLTQASVKEANGEADAALAILSDLTKSPREPTAVRAAFEVARLGVERGKMTPAQAIDALEALRFRWRGDGIELETIRRLGALYASAGRTRDGLSVMRAATLRFPEQPASRRMAQDMSDIFDRLFLNGEADRLDPIVAVGLFYEFKDLTPVGSDGDLMIRKLADRLVAFDLLPQAEQLLAYQVNNRLHGLAKAQVATELASIQLADRRPQDTLVTLLSSRVARLPDDLNRQRRMIQAAALASVGRFEHAVELLELDPSKEADRMRADVFWRMKDWPNAAAALQKVLPPGTGGKALPADQEDLVLRAAIALQFADDGAGLAKLDKQYRPVMELGARSSAFDMVVTGLDTTGLRLQELASRVAGDGLYDRFLDRFKKRFAADAAAKQDSAGAASPAPASKPAKTADLGARAAG